MRDQAHDGQTNQMPSYTPSQEAPQSVYQASPLKRKRRTGDQLQKVLEAIRGILDGEEESITIRHLFYRLVSLKVIDKTEREYDSLVSHLAKWRRLNLIEWSAFVDSSRWHYGSVGFDSLQDALANTAECYRKNLWADQPHYVEIWAEKDAIASILLRAADSFGVKVFVARGFSSLSSLHSAAGTFRAYQQHGKEVHVYYFGDHDPSGLAIDRAMTDTLRDDFNVDIHFQRAAVRPEHIAQFNLPTRPTKSGDTRGKDWIGGCVEVDAMPPAVLKGIVEECITSHINPRAWATLKATETMERETLRRMVRAA